MNDNSPAPASSRAVLMAAAAAPLRIKILTLNTHKGFTFFNRKFVLHDLREAVRGAGADIVFLQEVMGSHREYSTRYENWPAGSHYEFLADTLWPQFAYGRNAVYPAGHHGNALLSKFPIARHHNFDVSIGSIEKRGLLHSVLKVPGHEHEVHAVCVHLGLREAHRQRQLGLLCDLIDRVVPTDSPLIIAGDFNDWRVRSHGLLQERAGLREIFVEAHGRAAQTFPARWPLLRLDRIYVRNVRVCKTEVLAQLPWSHLSDHAALAAELEI